MVRSFFILVNKQRAAPDHSAPESHSHKSKASTGTYNCRVRSRYRRCCCWRRSQVALFFGCVPDGFGLVQLRANCAEFTMKRAKQYLALLGSKILCEYLHVVFCGDALALLLLLGSRNMMCTCMCSSCAHFRTFIFVFRSFSSVDCRTLTFDQ